MAISSILPSLMRPSSSCFTTRFYDRLLRYDRLDKTLTILEGDTQSLGCIALIHDQWVVCDRTSGRPGLRFVDLASDRLEETLTPTTLAPLQLISAPSVP